MTDFEVEFQDSSSALHKEIIKNVVGYQDSSDGHWIDFVSDIYSPATTQERRFPAPRVIGIRRVTER